MSAKPLKHLHSTFSKKQTAPTWSCLCKLRVIVEVSDALPDASSTIDRRFGFLRGRMEAWRADEKERGSVPLGERLPRRERLPRLELNLVPGQPSKAAGVLEEVLGGLNADLWAELKELAMGTAEAESKRRGSSTSTLQCAALAAAAQLASTK